MQAVAVDVFTVSQRSMVPTLAPGDRVLVVRPPVDRPVQVGDVVVVDVRGSFLPGRASGGLAAAGPARWLAPPPPGALVVKRVVAMGGDRVTCCDGAGRLLVDGEPTEEPYLSGGPAAPEAFDVEVPAGTVWLLGDNRAASDDSLDHLGDPGGGGVRAEALVGRVVSVLRIGARDAG